jgi:hypothetical protein
MLSVHAAVAVNSDFIGNFDRSLEIIGFLPSRKKNVRCKISHEGLLKMVGTGFPFKQYVEERALGLEYLHLLTRHLNIVGEGNSIVSLESSIAPREGIVNRSLGMKNVFRCCLRVGDKHVMVSIAVHSFRSLKRVKVVMTDPRDGFVHSSYFSVDQVMAAILVPSLVDGQPPSLDDLTATQWQGVAKELCETSSGAALGTI